MIIKPMPTEIVYQNSDEKQRQVLKNHFNSFYILLAESQLIPNAVFETKGDIQRCLSGIPTPYHNAVMGCPEKSYWDDCISEQIRFFDEAKMPFVWCLDEETDIEFKKKLQDYGFQDGGVLRGVIGILDKPIPNPEISSDCVLELVESESTMEEFNQLVCDTFGLQGVSKDLYKKALWESTKNNRYQMFHWLARKNGKVVSALSTLIEGKVVSFWNGASSPECRRQGISTALRRLALQNAKAHGCQIGISYIMSEGLAFGICSKLGYQTKWRFNVFLSPKH